MRGVMVFVLDAPMASDRGVACRYGGTSEVICHRGGAGSPEAFCVVLAALMQDVTGDANDPLTGLPFGVGHHPVRAENICGPGFMAIARGGDRGVAAGGKRDAQAVSAFCKVGGLIILQLDNGMRLACAAASKVFWQCSAFARWCCARTLSSPSNCWAAGTSVGLRRYRYAPGPGRLGVERVQQLSCFAVGEVRRSRRALFISAMVCCVAPTYRPADRRHGGGRPARRPSDRAPGGCSEWRYGPARASSVDRSCGVQPAAVHRDEGFGTIGMPPVTTARIENSRTRRAAIELSFALARSGICSASRSDGRMIARQPPGGWVATHRSEISSRRNPPISPRRRFVHQCCGTDSTSGVTGIESVEQPCPVDRGRDIENASLGSGDGRKSLQAGEQSFNTEKQGGRHSGHGGEGFWRFAQSPIEHCAKRHTVFLLCAFSLLLCVEKLACLPWIGSQEPLSACLDWPTQRCAHLARHRAEACVTMCNARAIEGDP